MRLINVSLYFLIAVIIVGTIGIWLPTLLQYFKDESISQLDILQNCVTYFTAIIVAGCIDIILSNLKAETTKNRPGLVLLMILIFIISIGLVIFSSIYILKGNTRISYRLVSIGILMAWILWWISNWNRQELDPTDALGGKI